MGELYTFKIKNMNNDLAHLDSIKKVGANYKILATNKNTMISIFVFDRFFIATNINKNEAKKYNISDLDKFKNILKNKYFSFNKYINN